MNRIAAIPLRPSRRGPTEQQLQPQLRRDRHERLK